MLDSIVFILCDSIFENLLFLLWIFCDVVMFMVKYFFDFKNSIFFKVKRLMRLFIVL